MLLLMITSCSSNKSYVKIVDSFCEGKYYPIDFKKEKVHIENLKSMAASSQSGMKTIEIISAYIAINEKEYRECSISSEEKTKQLLQN